MPQTFNVLNCFLCNTFQVHIVKKSSKKWECKMCGEKQTIRKIYAEGAARDCRDYVQKLNMSKSTKNVAFEQDDSEKLHSATSVTDRFENSGSVGSKWQEFLKNDGEQIVRAAEQRMKEIIPKISFKETIDSPSEPADQNLHQYENPRKRQLSNTEPKTSKWSKYTCPLPVDEEHNLTKSKTPTGLDARPSKWAAFLNSSTNDNEVDKVVGNVKEGRVKNAENTGAREILGLPSKWQNFPSSADEKSNLTKSKTFTGLDARPSKWAAFLDSPTNDNEVDKVVGHVKESWTENAENTRARGLSGLPSKWQNFLSSAEDDEDIDAALKWDIKSSKK